MKRIIYIFLIIAGFNTQAQINENNEEWINYIFQLYKNEDAEENQDFDNLMEELLSITENPYNLHSVKKEELEKLPFLSAVQIENLLYYIYKYSPLFSIYELKNVEDLDTQTLCYLLPFVYLGDINKEKKFTNTENTLKHSKQEFVLRTNFTLQEKAGYKNCTKEERNTYPNRYYLGDKYLLGFRYQFNIQNKFQIGVSGKKDPGEKFHKHYPLGFDYYTFNVLAKEIGIIKELHLGNYRLSFGEGLVLNNHFSLGKTGALLPNTHRPGIKRHLSSGEDGYFNGIAGKGVYKNFSLILFFSSRLHSGNTNDSTIFSFKTDGLFRTYNDLKKRNTINIQTIGNHLSWTNNNINWGFTSVYYSFGKKELNPELRSYNLYYLRGHNYYNLGINYFYRKKKWNLKGEIALDKKNKIAFLTTLSLKPYSFLDWIISFRYYDKKYNSFFSKAFGESSSIQNETGIYTGFKLKVIKNWDFSGYLDYFSFPWLKYGIDSPSSGSDLFLNLQYSKTKTKIIVNNRLKQKHKNIKNPSKDTPDISPFFQNKTKCQIHYVPNNLFRLKTEINFNHYKELKTSWHSGSITQNVSYNNPSSPINLDGGISFFNSKNWNNRISIYEKNILHAFNFVNYYGKGIRYYFIFKWQVIQPLSLYFKWGSTHYFNQETIGSGTEKIEGKAKTDIYGSIRYKF